MCGRGLLKRFVPFFLTFAAGLFIASFFVSVAAPFSGFSRGERRFGYVRVLREENQRLQDRVEELEQQRTTSPCIFDSSDFDAPPPPPVPMRPAAPRAVR